MAQIESKKIPFSYQESTSFTGRNQTQNIELVTVFDTNLKKTFVYQENFLGRGQPLATIGTDGKVVPFQDSSGNFTASNNLRNQLQNNANLNNSLTTSTRDAVKRNLGLNNPSLIANVTEKQIDDVMGTNKATNTESASRQSSGNGSGTTTTPIGTIAQELQGSNAEISDDNVRPSYGPPLIYPEGLESYGQDYVKFEMYRYKPKGLSGENVLTGGINPSGSTNKGSSKGTVVLPIQSPASDSNTVGWSEGSMTGVEAALFNVAYQGITNGLDQAAFAAGTELNNIVTNQGYKNTLGIYFAQQAAQINNAFTRVTGGILNPNLELLFQGPQLRSFNFTFKLSAREQSEADTIRKIIRFFKQGMSVKKSSSALFLKSPDIFTITYFKSSEKGSGEHKALNKFKSCALQAFNVDYTPLGSYMTFNDAAGTMVAYTITMQFQEIDPVYDDDYNTLSEDAIGY